MGAQPISLQRAPRYRLARESHGAGGIGPLVCIVSFSSILFLTTIAAWALRAVLAAVEKPVPDAVMGGTRREIGIPEAGDGIQTSFDYVIAL